MYNFVVSIITCITFSLIQQTMSVDTDYLWPLNYPYYGYETKQGRESLNPAQDRTIPYVKNSNTYLNVSSSLVFDRDNYIDVQVDDSVVFLTLTFNIFLKAVETRPRNVIAHYVADSNKPDTIRQFIMEGNDDDVIVTYIFDDGNEIAISCSNDLKIGIWKLYTIMQINADEKLFAYFDLSHKHEENLSNYPTKLNTPGILRFGGHQSIASIGFVGEMSCATLLNEEIPLVVDSIVSVCNNIPSEPPDKTLIWPLDAMALGYEVQTNTPPSTRMNAFQFTPGPAELPNDAIHFDGWPLSKIITNISSERLQNEFEISFYISTMRHGVGTILQIANNQDPPVGIVNLKIEIVVNGTKVTIMDASGLCGNIVVTDMPLPWSWRVLGIQRRTHDLFLIIENRTYHAADTCTPASSASSEDMTMTIGGGTLIEEGFKGQIRCLAVFEYIHNANQLPTAIVTKCTSADVANFYKPESIVTSNLKTTNQKLMMISKQPPPEIRPVTIRFTRSLSDCGRQCLAEDDCRSYTYNRHTRQCEIFNLFLIHELISANGENYYGVTLKK
ncbi:hypothetical protein LOTGIDRAFT_234844 [Lottia gigantea]|uniref:Apple domain-containing protein n=1 Tax=Lottia gigantea TaxID=225164 RepID=V4BFS5_LOTGI|nr:hypothetical protein LOTGIDRAFT_234844 [Lottia gigantea]ESO87829.1 hypothetical protein LOTGIDRAFT_234844 [Lottia gigantea]